MEKLGKTKHDHKAVKVFKLTIFFILMLAPFLSVLTTCLYTTFNPNAMDSTSIIETQYRKVEYQTNEVNSVDDLIVGNVYNFEWVYEIIPSGTPNVIVGSLDNFDFLSFHYKKINGYTDVVIRFTGSINANVITIGNYTDTPNIGINGYGYVSAYDDNIVKIAFIYLGGLPNNYQYISYIKEADLTQIPSQYEEIETTTLDNAFNYAVNNLANNNLFNWTMNTAMYTTINSVCSGLTMGTSGNILALLITYWILLTIIYILFDIIIEMFVKLTHIFA